MGINSSCYLYNDVRADDVVEAIAFLCGATRIEMPLRGIEKSIASSHDFSEVQTEPNKKAKFVYVRSTHDMQYYEVVISATDCDNESHYASLFLYPDHKHPNRILVYAGVSDFWKKIDRALVDMFGGEVDDNDCDSSDVDYKKKKPRKSNCPPDGKAWQDYQNDMLNLPKLFNFVVEK